MQTSPVDTTRTLARLPKSADLETHVRLLHLDERRIVEFVDYVPSLDQFGRGYWITVTGEAELDALIAAVVATREK